MRYKVALIVFALQFLWPGSVAFSLPRTDDLSAKLSKRVSSYNLGTVNFIQALLKVSSDFQIPMGISWVNTSATRASSSLSWKDAPVREVVETIVKTQPGYRVQMRNGVVHTLRWLHSNCTISLVPQDMLVSVLAEISSQG